VIEHKGLFCALYSDRGSHFWLMGDQLRTKQNAEQSSLANRRKGWNLHQESCRLRPAEVFAEHTPVRMGPTSSSITLIAEAACEESLKSLSIREVRNCLSVPPQAANR
jgi:hypothetical protein